MKCLSCQTENKDGFKTCKKCGANLQMEAPWRPTWGWHAKVLGGIYIFLILAYFGISKFLNSVPPPYRLREIPKDITPWLKK